MTSPQSHAFKNLKLKQKTSPVVLKEKLRRNYKDKVQNCRNILLDKFRSTVGEAEVRNTLTEIYKSLYHYSDDYTFDDEETEILEEIKNELVQEELQWCLREYEKSHSENLDWSSMEQEDNVICLICQKTNFTLKNNFLSCANCNSTVNTNKTLLEIKNMVEHSLEKHNAVCNNETEFVMLTESNEKHIYLICGTCLEMQLVV